MENQLVFKALHDSLTGLPNRDLCLERLQRLLDDACSCRRGFAAAFVDLDRCKMLNDSLGHSFGDRVLLEAAQRLSHGVAGRGEVCRFGGDEFVLLVNRADGAQDAKRAIDEALEALCAPMRGMPNSLHTSGSRLRGCRQRSRLAWTVQRKGSSGGRRPAA